MILYMININKNTTKQAGAELSSGKDKARKGFFTLVTNRGHLPIKKGGWGAGLTGNKANSAFLFCKQASFKTPSNLFSMIYLRETLMFKTHLKTIICTNW